MCHTGEGRGKQRRGKSELGLSLPWVVKRGVFQLVTFFGPRGERERYDAIAHAVFVSYAGDVINYT